MKILLEYTEATGEIKDKNGITTFYTGLVGFEQEKSSDVLVLDLVKQGITPDEIIKLKNSDLI